MKDFFFGRSFFSAILSQTEVEKFPIEVVKKLSPWELVPSGHEWIKFLFACSVWSLSLPPLTISHTGHSREVTDPSRAKTTWLTSLCAHTCCQFKICNSHAGLWKSNWREYMHILHRKPRRNHGSALMVHFTTTSLYCLRQNYGYFANFAFTNCGNVLIWLCYGE